MLKVLLLLYRGGGVTGGGGENIVTDHCDQTFLPTGVIKVDLVCYNFALERGSEISQGPLVNIGKLCLPQRV